MEKQSSFRHFDHRDCCKIKVGLPWTFHKLGCPCLEPAGAGSRTVQWSAQQTNRRGHIVLPPSGRQVVVHLTFSGVTSVIKVIKEIFSSATFPQTDRNSCYLSNQKQHFFNHYNGVLMIVENVEVTTTVIKEWERYTRKFALSSYADPVNHVCTSQAKPPISVKLKGKSQRAEARCPKGRERGWSWRGQPAPSPPGTPTAKRFSCILQAPDDLSWNLLVAKFGGMALLRLRLNMPVVEQSDKR